MMLFQQQVDESMSNLTSASGEASGSSDGNKAAEFPYNFTPSMSHQQPPPPNKKKRNLPGNPDPEAEVIALSPKTLMATNRFVCEICKKGFQREQNLQLHRRGHNLPWKLKQRPSNESAVRKKKVYVCPEPGCVHHDPARALGDLTGVKKHFSRKHGHKRWNCHRCSKRYAVHSDWKAHSKTCGTREYRCDCGTVFSRRDSFVTHRAFCEALAEEAARLELPIPLPYNNLHVIDNYDNNHLRNSVLKLEHQTGFFSTSSSSTLMPPWLGPHFYHGQLDFSDRHFAPNPNPNPNPSPATAHRLPAFPPPTPPAYMSATALLQKAAQMGATMSADADEDKPRQHHRDISLSSPNNAAAAAVTMGDAEACFGGFLKPRDHVISFSGKAEAARETGASAGSGNNNGGDQAGLTRDFLGLRALSHSDILSLAGLGNSINISRDQPHHMPW